MPVSSKEVLARGTLELIGSESGIESFTEGSPEARKVSLFYDQVIEETLEAFDWGFARKSQLLSKSAVCPNNSWLFRYDEPEDCITPRRIFSPLGRLADYPPFEREVTEADIRTLLTNQEKAELQYTKRIINTTLFSPLFVAAARHWLGYYISVPLLGKNGRTTKNDMRDEFIKIIKQAADSDSNSEKVEQDQEADWISVR